jgi:thiol:disulfide interchange protein DsbD
MKYIFVVLLVFFVSPLTIAANQEAVIIYENHNIAVDISKEQNKPLLLIFSADWCDYCTKLKTEILSTNETSDYVSCIIDVDNNKDLVKKYKVRILPTSIVIKDGEQVIKSKTGFQGKKDYLKWLGL